MKSQEIRERFLKYFSDRGHKIVPSSSLLPKDDPTLLFTNAGMNQFKNVFLGLEKRSYQRAVSVQKCMRVSGKHNDLEMVGKTSKHHTFFEMLGNFSFGDYFKRDAVHLAWELMTQEYGFPKDRLFITVFRDDDEAYAVWKKEIGIPDNMIFRMGEEDNYWSMGETGPCGPCSEIHYDLNPSGGGDPRTLIETGHERFIELWNLVFMQYNRDKDGSIRELPSPSIDTGMGLERMAAVLQGKKNNYDTDLFAPLLKKASEIAGVEFPAGQQNLVHLRIIADHMRAVTFLIGDGIMPANEGRGYVLRRLIRRSFRAGQKMGIEKPFLYTLVGVVCDIMKNGYPELLKSADYISQICLAEEERFADTLTAGLKTFDRIAAQTKKASRQVIPGEQVFKLYDTYGFPLDLSQELAGEEGLKVDEKGFFLALEKQRRRARKSWKGDAEQEERRIYEPFKDLKVRFEGYDRGMIPDAEVLAVLKDGKAADSLKEGEAGEIFLDRTPFYAEAGGQVGDSGKILSSKARLDVETTYYPIPELISHKIKVKSGVIHPGETVEAVIDQSQRKDISRNHTSTHLLHASLRRILGPHVKQSGSLVSSGRLRFDFTHYASLSTNEIERIESLANQKILEDIPVSIRETTMEEGIKSGAVAIFDERYGEKVRVVTVGDFSKELCGGVHVNRTGEIGVFKIKSEGSVAAGMRRIEAVTGKFALAYFRKNEELLNDIQNMLQTPRNNLLTQIEKIQEALKEKEKECASMRQKVVHISSQKKDKKVHNINGVSILTQRVDGLSQPELRNLADSHKQKIGSGVVVLGTVHGGKALLVAAVSKDLTERITASEIIKKIAPVVGGGGGGRPDFAQAGGASPGKLDQALSEGLEFLKTKISPLKGIDN
ncbi:MAG: alanine--tRNA ligase [Candidatus Aminicenantes bacterium]